MSKKEQDLSKALAFFNNNEFAASTYLNKYSLRDKEGNVLEPDPQQCINRVMRVLADSMPEKKDLDGFYDSQGNPTAKLSTPSEEWLQRVFGKEYNPLRSDTRWTWYELFAKACGKFEGVVPQGSILSAAGDKSFPQSLSNCFVIPPPEDSINGISKRCLEGALVARRRGGWGLDLSTLRPVGAFVANAARTSSGVAGWMNYFSDTSRSIAQGGRRSALMLTLDIAHPDALAFAQAKQDLTYCTGANVSLKISNEFMEAVKKDGVFTQQWPIDSKTPVIKNTIKARELWHKIIECAWSTAEPGLLFWDHSLDNLPANFYPDYKSSSTNPCSEIILSPYDSCRLTTICLTKYVINKFKEDSYFDLESFEKDIRIAMRMLDAVVTSEIEAVDQILAKVEDDRENSLDKDSYITEIDLWKNIRTAAVNGRRTGLGTHGLGDCLSQLKLKYDSEQALEQVDKIYKTLRDVSYDESIEMAKDYGPFPVYDYELEKDCAFIKRLPKKLREKMQVHGRRNISILTNAPTGTISIMSQVSSGIEPTFRQMYTRRRKINSNDLDSRVDFVDQNGDKWMEFPVFEKNVERYFEAVNKEIPKNVKSDEELKEYLPKYFITSDKINWTKRVELQSTAQNYIDHAISSTVNIPNSATVEDVKEIYETAWKKGLKGITVYRDNCRTGVLITNENKNNRPRSIERTEAPKRPDKLPCEVHFTKIKGEEFIVIVGLLNGSVYEVFFGEYANQIPKKQFSGYIEKKGKSKYLLNFIKDTELDQIDINKYFNNKDYAAATRLLSMSLRHGACLEHIIDQLQKSSDSLVEFGPALSRVLKKYISIEDLQEQAIQEHGENIEVKVENGCVTIINLDTGEVDSKCG